MKTWTILSVAFLAAMIGCSAGDEGASDGGATESDRGRRDGGSGSVFCESAVACFRSFIAPSMACGRPMAVYGSEQLSIAPSL